MYLPNQLTIYIDQHNFYIASWRWSSLKKIHYGQQDNLLGSLHTFIDQLNKNTCVDIILERIDETFQQELLPKLSAKESRLFLKRKLLHHFSNNTFHSVIPFHRKSHQSRYILVGVETDELLQELISLIIQAKLCLRAMYISAQVSTVAVMQSLKRKSNQKLSLIDQSSLIIEILPHQMVRKSFMIGANLVMSHCTPLHLFDTQTDIQKTLTYCQNLNLSNVVTNTNLILLRYADDTPNQQYAEQCNMVIEANSISHLAKSGYSERAHFLMEAVRRHKIPGNLLTPQHQKHYRAMLWREKLWLSSFLLFILICVFLIRLELLRQGLIDQTKETHQQQTIWHDNLRTQQAKLPLTPKSFSKIEDLVDLDTKLRKEQQSPAWALQKLSLVLAQNPTVRIDRLRWIYSHQALSPDEESLSLNAFKPAERIKGLEHARFHTLYLNGVLVDSSLSLATSAKIFNNFLLGLKSQEELFLLDVLAYPTDISISHSQQLSLGQINQGKPFALRLSYLNLEE